MRPLPQRTAAAAARGGPISAATHRLAQKSEMQSQLSPELPRPYYYGGGGHPRNRIPYFAVSGGDNFDGDHDSGFPEPQKLTLIPY